MRTILSSPATGRGSYYNAVPFSVGFYDISHELKTFNEVNLLWAIDKRCSQEHLCS